MTDKTGKQRRRAGIQKADQVVSNLTDHSAAEKREPVAGDSAEHLDGVSVVDDSSDGPKDNGPVGTVANQLSTKAKDSTASARAKRSVARRQVGTRKADHVVADLTDDAAAEERDSVADEPVERLNVTIVDDRSDKPKDGDSVGNVANEPSIKEQDSTASAQTKRSVVHAGAAASAGTQTGEDHDGRKGARTIGEGVVSTDGGSDESSGAGIDAADNSVETRQRSEQRLPNWLSSVMKWMETNLRVVASGGAAGVRSEGAEGEEGDRWSTPSWEPVEAKWFWRAGYRIDDEGNATAVILDAKPQRDEDLSDEATTLLKAIETASVRLRTAFRQYPEESRPLFRSLKRAAEIGLCGPTPDPALAGIYFESFKNMVPAASDKLRKKFLKATIWWNLGVSVLALSVFLSWLAMHSSVFYDLQAAASHCEVTDLGSFNDKNTCWNSSTARAFNLARTFFSDWGSAPDLQQARSTALRTSSNLVMGYALAVVGGSIGIILIGFLRNREITYDSFDEIYQYAMSPARYLLLIMVLALVVLILVAFNVFILGVGNVTLNEVVNQPQIGLIIGLLCSVSEPLVSSMVINQVKPAEARGNE